MINFFKCVLREVSSASLLSPSQHNSLYLVASSTTGTNDNTKNDARTASRRPHRQQWDPAPLLAPPVHPDNHQCRLHGDNGTRRHKYKRRQINPRVSEQTHVSSMYVICLRYLRIWGWTLNNPDRWSVKWIGRRSPSSFIWASTCGHTIGKEHVWKLTYLMALRQFIPRLLITGPLSSPWRVSYSGSFDWRGLGRDENGGIGHYPCLNDAKYERNR